MADQTNGASNETNQDVHGNLSVVAAHWSMWDADAKLAGSKIETEKHYNFNISNNCRYELDFNSEKVLFTVTNISEDEIVILLPRGLVPNDTKGAFPLPDEPQKSIIIKKNGEEVQTRTQTMDAGMTFTFKYIV